MSRITCLAPAVAFLMSACASAVVPPGVSPAAPAASAPAAPLASAHPVALAEPEPTAPEPEAQCAGTRPQPEAKSHRDWPPSPRATCCYPDKEGIQRVIRSKYPDMRRCYQTALTGSNPELMGRVSVKFTVQPDGTVPFACDSGSSLKNRQMIDCVLGVFLELRFPEQSGDLCPKYMTIVYPIVFQPD